MTDLTTTNLKRLLEQATPGPWEAEEDVWGHVDVSDGTGHKMIWGGYCGFQSKSDPKLAAHAPELAEEVIRLRKGLKAIRSDLHESTLCNGGTDIPYLQGITEQAEETKKHIDQLLGDHDD